MGNCFYYENDKLVPIDPAKARNVKRVWVDGERSLKYLHQHTFDDAIVCANNVIFFHVNGKWFLSGQDQKTKLEIDIHLDSYNIEEKVLVLLSIYYSIYMWQERYSMIHFTLCKCMSTFYFLYNELVEARKQWITL